jgi:hypothetical protein
MVVCQQLNPAERDNVRQADHAEFDCFRWGEFSVAVTGSLWAGAIKIHMNFNRPLVLVNEMSHLVCPLKVSSSVDIITVIINNKNDHKNEKNNNNNNNNNNNIRNKKKKNKE